MLRIHFTVEDMTNIRMAATLGPLAESAFALYLYGHNGDVAFHQWRRTIRAELGHDAGRFTALSQKFHTLSELPQYFPDAFVPEATSSRTNTSGADPEQTKMLSDLCRVAVLPQWSQIRGHLDGTRDKWGRVAIAHGIERMLDAIHPRLRWRAPVLELRDGPQHDVHLGGRGLLFIPSYFLSDQTCLFLDAAGEDAMPAIAFPVKASSRKNADGEGEYDVQALGALVGHTRAAALAALIEGCSTSELADRLGISLAGASKHAAVLRRSGLVTTARNRNTALHALTPLGTALLRSCGFLPPPPDNLRRVLASRRPPLQRDGLQAGAVLCKPA